MLLFHFPSEIEKFSTVLSKVHWNYILHFLLDKMTRIYTMHSHLS